MTQKNDGGQGMLTMPPGEEIVPLAPAHIERMAEIEKLCFADPWSARMLTEELDNPLARYLIYMRAGEAMGYIGAHLVAGEGYITNVAVHPSFRGRGAAKRLLSAMDGLARREKLRFLTLEVRRSNQNARALYRQAGFEEAGLRRGYYEHPKEDAVLMTLFYEDDTQER